MKFRFFSIFALTGLLLGACAVDEFPAEGGSFIAEMETDQTRTAVTDEGAFTWSTGDQVWLHTTAGSVLEHSQQMQDHRVQSSHMVVLSVK
jgi:hypothetical protein